MNHKIKAQAFVLKKRQLLESDLQATLYSRELGKIVVIAKGARSFKSRRAPHLQTGNLINVILFEKHNTFYIQQTDLVSAFSQIRNPKNMSYLYQFLYAVEGLTPQNENDESIFFVIKDFILSLHVKNNSHNTVLVKSLTSLLSKLGYIDESSEYSDVFDIIEETLGRPLPKHAIINTYEK